jgi:hypothetical protein
MSKAAVRMEENELAVLRKAFTGPEARPIPIHLRARALGYASYSAAIRYEASGMRIKALARLARSFLLWPFPFRRDETRVALARLQKLAVILRQSVRRPESVGADGERRRR